MSKGTPGFFDVDERLAESHHRAGDHHTNRNARLGPYRLNSTAFSNSTQATAPRLNEDRCCGLSKRVGYPPLTCHGRITAANFARSLSPSSGLKKSDESS
jgi:hypothetical protein